MEKSPRTPSPSSNPSSPSDLLCEEDSASFLQSDDENTSIDTSNTINSLNLCGILENEEEYIENLLRSEKGFEFGSSNDRSSTALKSARLDAIDWIFSTREKLGFKIHTAYLSVTYFDWFLSKKPVDEGKPWVFSLLSVACLSLAAKMEETEFLLSKFFVAAKIGAAKFNSKDCCIDHKSIKKMEFVVLGTLEWKMRPVTPLDYLHYLVSKFYSESKSEAIVSKAGEHIVAIVKDVNLMDHRPSVIALAATLAAFDAILTRETMDLQISFFPSWLNLETQEHVFSIYNLMMKKEKERRKLMTPASGRLTSRSSFTSVLDSSSVTSSGAKRKLNFDDSENSTQQKLHRP